MAASTVLHKSWRRFVNGADHYSYAPLPSGQAIRLLRILPRRGPDIECALETYEQSEAPPYHALSYTWGYPLTPFSLPKVTGSENETLDSSFRRNRLNAKADNNYFRRLLHGDSDTTPGPSRSRHIHCRGQKLQVTQSLHDALETLQARTWGLSMDPRPRHPRLNSLKHVWIDAICVDQDNIEERNAQVARMRWIFQEARRVTVWLGEEDQFTEDALALIEHISSLAGNAWESIGYTDFFRGDWHKSTGKQPPLSYYHWLGFLAFITRPWFRRAWIIQELAMSKSAVLVCGRKTIPWSQLNTTLHFLKKKRWYHHLSTEKMQHIAEVRKDPGIYADFLKSKTSFGVGPLALSWTKHWTENRNAFQGPVSLAVLMQLHRDTDATDPRDKVYAFLGLAAESKIFKADSLEPLQPDYNQSVQQTYSQVASSQMISQGDLSLLSHVQDASRTKLANLPSWIPDFSVSLHPYPLLFRGRCHWSACGNEKWEPNIKQMQQGLLHLRGHRAGIVAETALMPNETDDTAAYWAGIVKLASHLKDYYPHTRCRQTRIEALWRTLVTDTYSRKHPAPDSCSQLFIDYVLNLQIRHTLAPWSSRVDFHPHQQHRHPSTPADWHGLLFSNEPPDSSCGATAYRTRMAAVMEGIFGGTYSAMDLAQMQHELDISSGNNRRVFRTENGLLGTGAKSVRANDEVWVLCGANVPFVLRRAGDGGRYRLVGEAYVHGLMHWEGRGDPPDMNLFEEVVLE